jgi:hypothetical protein
MPVPTFKLAAAVIVLATQITYGAASPISQIEGASSASQALQVRGVQSPPPVRNIHLLKRLYYSSGSSFPYPAIAGILLGVTVISIFIRCFLWSRITEAQKERQMAAQVYYSGAPVQRESDYGTPVWGPAGPGVTMNPLPPAPAAKIREATHGSLPPVYGASSPPNAGLVADASNAPYNANHQLT